MAYEQLSALLDGECTAEELDLLLEEMERSPELKARWSRLCLARDTRDGTRYTKEQTCICAGVMAQLDRVPAELARPNVVELRRPRAMLVKQAIGWAVAASVATVALLVGDAAGRLSILLISVLAGEAASAVWVLRQLRLSIRPEAFANSRSLMVVGLATVAMLPGIALGHWALYVLQPERLMELVVLMVCGAVTLAAFLAVIRFIGLKAIAEPT